MRKLAQTAGLGRGASLPARARAAMRGGCGCVRGAKDNIPSLIEVEAFPTSPYPVSLGRIFLNAPTVNEPSQEPFASDSK
jgi:hypothetical protein